MQNEQDLRKENLKIDNFRVQLSQIVNNSNLSVGVVYFILKDVLKEVESLFSQAATNEYNEFCSLVQKKQEEENKIKKEETE